MHHHRLRSRPRLCGPKEWRSLGVTAGARPPIRATPISDGPLHSRHVKKVASWAVTIPFLAAFGLVLIVFDLAGRLVRPFSLTGFEWVMGALQWALVTVLRIFGTHVEIDRSPAIRPAAGYVVISNHQSMFDIALIGDVLFSNLPKYVAKAELGRWIPSVSLNLKQGGHALIERDNARQALDEIAAFGQRVQAAIARRSYSPKAPGLRMGSSNPSSEPERERFWGPPTDSRWCRWQWRDPGGSTRCGRSRPARGSRSAWEIPSRGLPTTPPNACARLRNGSRAGWRPSPNRGLRPHTSSMMAISVASPRRGPSFTILV